MTLHSVYEFLDAASYFVYSAILMSTEGVSTFKPYQVFQRVKVKVKVKLRFSAPSAGIAEVEQT